jgi:hypothetical protein
VVTAVRRHVQRRAAAAVLDIRLLTLGDQCANSRHVASRCRGQETGVIGRLGRGRRDLCGRYGDPAEVGTEPERAADDETYQRHGADAPPAAAFRLPQYTVRLTTERRGRSAYRRLPPHCGAS